MANYKILSTKGMQILLQCYALTKTVPNKSCREERYINSTAAHDLYGMVLFYEYTVAELAQ